MGLKSALSKPLARFIAKKNRKWMALGELAQKSMMDLLLASGKKTQYGRKHHLGECRTYEEFRQAIPLVDYEGLRPYIDEILLGKEDVLWPGKPLYLAKTSGTTSGVKYIPITKESIPNHINSARDAILSYIHETGSSAFLDKKLIFLSGSPQLTEKAGIHVGRLSGISNHHVPAYLRKNQLPSYETNCIEDWETKLERIIDETIDQPMSLISGIPPWVQMYFDRIIERTNKPIKEVFPEFSLFIYGGVNFEPYKSKLFQSIGGHVDSIETYPASEGFIAYQNSQQDNGLLMLLNSGIFFEFIPVESYFDQKPKRLSIEEVSVGKNYALVINNNAGLWGYSIGDTVRFVSISPYKIVVTGRIKHFISAFGEHVIGEEVEKALIYAVSKQPETKVVEFTVAPMVSPPSGGTPFHEWLIEFDQPPNDITIFSADLDQRMAELNIYYRDLIEGNILRPLVVTSLMPNAFIDYMRSLGRLGGQNKVPRLSNDRQIADTLAKRP